MKGYGDLGRKGSLRFIGPSRIIWWVNVSSVVARLYGKYSRCFPISMFRKHVRYGEHASIIDFTSLDIRPDVNILTNLV